MHMGTALKTGIKYEASSNELYTADAGIDTGLWRIKYDYMGPEYGPYDYASTWIYETDPVNHSTADVSVQNLWLPSNVTLAGVGLNAETAAEMIETEKLIVSGTSGVNPGQPFHIKMDFNPADGDNLTIKSIGVWLPQGYTYTAGNSELEQLSLVDPCRPDSVSIQTVAGGSTVVWSYNPPYPLFIAFPNYAVDDGTLTVTFSFTYAPPASDPTKMPLAMTWATTAMDPTCINPDDVPLAWDTDIRYYKITSLSGDTNIETYTSKSQLRNLGNGTAGDYIAIGNSVMLDNYYPYDKRDTVLAESSTDVAEVAPIPANGDVLYAYLYWSGFRHSQSLWADACSAFTNWTLAASDGTLDVLPTGDGLSSGTWTTAPLTEKVNETTSAGDSDYIIGTTDGGGYQLFSFDTISILEQPIASVTVHIRARDDTATTGTNDIRPAIKINGVANPYYNATNNPGTSFTDYSYTWTANPKTSAAWTYDDITNASSTNGLQQFGVYSSDLLPDMRVSICYLTVTYSAYWSINSGQFQGRGANNNGVDPRYLTMTSSYNLSGYDPGTICVGWTQSDYESSGSLETDDTLYYAFSADGGATWSNGASWNTDDEVFHDDITSGSNFILVPEEYLTSGFKMRFYYNFDDPTEYVRLDNINIYYMPPDTSVTFKIDGEQVCFDGDGEPVSATGNLTAGFSAVLINQAGSTAAGYSYACYKDVTELVKKYPETPGETHHTGNYEFTVGNVSADTGEYISYAGWSLIIIYSSPDTAGRYIYLRDIHDIFAFNPGSTNLDFDNDGVAGGDVTGFLFPEPVRDKYGDVVDPRAAKITCFVGEGDDIYTGDTLMITGQQSGLSEYLSNDESPQNNIWNSASPGMSYPGVDVDTFEILWEDGILTPKDTSLHLDMNSGTDAWNLVYFIMSVRSETVTAGTGHYLIDNN